MSRADEQGGLRPATPAACRAFLASLDDATASREHAATCARCAAHLAFRKSIGPALRARPMVPPELLSRSLLESTCERIVDAAEAASPLGELLANREALISPAEPWPEHLLDSAIADRLRSAPSSPTTAAWNEVRASVVARLAVRRMARARWTLWVGAAAAAATVVLGLSIAAKAPKNATIVFADLASVPAVDYFVVRHGVR